jgi:hypothetical protein
MDTVESSSAPEAESNLVRHAREELQRAGLFDIDGDYGGMIGQNVLDMVRLFAGQGHSGFSAQLSIDVLSRLLRFQPLTPITSDPAEWMCVNDGADDPIWQNRRSSSLFSVNGGKTWYDIDNLPLRMRVRRFFSRFFPF